MPDQFAEALNRQEEMLGRVEALARDNQRQRWQLIILAAVVVALVVVVGFGARGLSNLRTLTAREESNRVTAMIENCRVRNGAARGTREQFGKFYDLISQFAPTPEGQQFVATGRASIPRPEEQDLDCNASGGLDAADYPTSP